MYDLVVYMSCFAKYTEHCSIFTLHCFLFLFIIFLPIRMIKEPMAISINCNSYCATTTYTLPKFLVFLIVFTSFSWKSSVSFSAAAVDQVSYADHCASFVPESTPKRYYRPRPEFQTGYYTGGGGGILSPNSSYQFQNSIRFSPWSVRETDVQGLFKVQAHLLFQRARIYFFVGNTTTSRPQYPGSIYNHKDSASVPNPWRLIRFLLDGFWSASSGKLCMVGVGAGYYYSHGRKYLHNHKVVLKLHNLMNSTTVTSFISGTLESLSKNDLNTFTPVYILMPPSMNYQYTLVSDNSCFGSGSDDSPSSLRVERFCSVLSIKVLNHEFDLKYSSHCVSSKNCSPFAGSYLPRVVSLKVIECSEDTRRLRVLVEFADRSRPWYQRPFYPNLTMVGEGSWDAKKNQLCVVACRLLDVEDSWNNAHVGDCSTRLSFRFPAIWTIENTSSTVGQIWSNKTVRESDYFEKITFESPQNEIDRFLLPGQKYGYTKIDKVTKLCPRKKTGVSPTGNANIYPNPFSYDMRFDMSAKNSRGVISWGSSIPFSVGSRFYNQYWYSMEVENSGASTEVYPVAPASAPVRYIYNHSIPYNISYKISIKLPSDAKSGNTSILNEVQISAEGIYDDTEGSLCMVGCRNLVSKTLQPTNDFVDCEIVVSFQFPPSNSSGFIKGVIKSTRQNSDPLHFEQLDLCSAAGYMVDAKLSIWRMDVEIILALISTTLACVFVALQLFHVKKHPGVLPSISIFMLLILTLGYMIPLMLNVEALFTNNLKRQKVFLASGGWLEVNELIVRAITMVGFLLKLRLLSLTWSARSLNNGTQNELWVIEKKAFIGALPIYVAGALAALLLMDWRKIASDSDVVVLSAYQEHPVLGSLKSYAGFVLDGFLLPQILLNMFCHSKETILSVSFYIGTTFVRVLPHAYDLYRARSHGSALRQLDESYIYASPAADFYSTSWDIIIPSVCLVFAGVIYLQQKLGGLCVLPQKLIELGDYEKVPTVTEAEG